MDIRTKQVLTALSVLGLSVLCYAAPRQEQEYVLEAFQKHGDPQSLILRVHPLLSGNRQSRQEEEDNESGSSSNNNNNHNHGPPTAPPFIPAVIPALSKIFTGIITGNLNDIFHGSTSFAPSNVSFIIDSVYNRVVGLQDPILTPPTTKRPPATEAPPVPKSPTEDPSSSEVVQPSPVSISSGSPSSTAAPKQPEKTTQSNNDEDDDELDARARKLYPV